MSDALELTPLPTEQWPESLGKVISDMGGQPINVHKLMAHNPALLQAWWNFRNYCVGGGSLGKRNAELVILRVGLHLRAWYEWGSHIERGRAAGLSLEEIERVKQGGQDAAWPEAEGLLLQAVDELLENHGLSEQRRAALEQHYSTAQLMDLMAIHGMYVILGCMINTWGLEVDEQVLEKLPEGITREAFERDYPRGPAG